MKWANDLYGPAYPTKVYVGVIDGILTWEPINALEIGFEKCLILPDNSYILDDPSVLYEFYTGDIVGVEDSFQEEYQ